MKAKVYTKSNYKNANGRFLNIYEFVGGIVCCLVPENGFDNDGKPIGKMIKGDFYLKCGEILEIRK